ncbi:hypothetical protein FRC04_008230 [Tulasnella sp. 424]|nr:hypothetical protein FRC04_008230 [Tulasnella sp. 424]KAG8974506.1 hypothetical protein FRC05_007305 [Tulasnella sp. 425]
MLSFVRNAVILFGSMGAARAVTLPTGEQAPPAPLLEDHGAQERFVGFQTCSPSIGLVHSVVVRDHDAGSASLESSSDTSIVFRSGSAYDITITFTSPVKAHRPRAGLIASDIPPASHSDPSVLMDGTVDSYAYSGQSFDGCKYTSCPVRAHTLSTYTYHFRTLHSNFSWLTFNVTTAIRGPSLFCVGFPVTFIDDEMESETSSSEEEATVPHTAWEPPTGGSRSESSRPAA